MSRRALPKLDPEIDFSNHLLEEKDLPQHQLETLFPNPELPLEIEVGTGKGLFIVNAAKNHPDVNFLGMEIAYRYARLVAYKAAKAEVTNLHMVSGDAQAMFTGCVPSNSVQAVHVYFPDPWWKKRHHKRRIMNSEMVKEIERALKPNGKLHFWTDVEEYYLRAVEEVEQSTNLTGPQIIPMREAEHHLDYQTHRERRVRLEGGKVFRSFFTKTVNSE